ncbi:MAG: hypothetical protein WD294_10740 [Phycisphaeraceae bacterium]
MSIFSKIFVVLVMVLSVVLVALIVPFAINTENYYDKWQSEEARRLIAENAQSNREAEFALSLDRAEQEKDRLRQQVTSLETDLAAQNRRMNDQQRTIIDLQNKNSDVRSQLARLSSGVDQQAQVNAVLQEEVRERREGEIRLQTQAIEIGDALRERSTQVDTLARQIRLLKEHNTDLSRQNEDLMARVETSSGPEVTEAMDGGFDPQTVIRGGVTHVQQIGDQTFVALNVGSNDTVREGMRFTIHDGDTYLGDTVITQVDQNTAAGRVILKRGDITSSAKVVAGLR